MSKDTASLASSETTTLNDPPKQGQTLLGKPITRDHDNLSNMMLGDGGAGFNAGAVGANLLPPSYTDNSLVRIPIRMSDVNGVSAEPTKKKGFFQRSPKDNDEIKMMMMARGDYLKYWVKGDDGKFAPGVVEPEGGRKAWFERQLELNREWLEADPSLGKMNAKGSGFNVGHALNFAGSSFT